MREVGGGVGSWEGGVEMDTVCQGNITSYDPSALTSLFPLSLLPSLLPTLAYLSLFVLASIYFHHSLTHHCTLTPRPPTLTLHSTVSHPSHWSDIFLHPSTTLHPSHHPKTQDSPVTTFSSSILTHHSRPMNPSRLTTQGPSHQSGPFHQPLPCILVSLGRETV